MQTTFPTHEFPIGYLISEPTIASLSTVSFTGVTYYVVFTETLTYPDFSIEVDRLHYPLGLYENITVRVGTQESSFSKDEPPPGASTGDVFEDSLVLNDMSSPQRVWYSFPQRPHSFPPVFFIDFHTKNVDEVQVVRTLGTKLGVWLRNSLWKVNWLPRESDFDFSSGRVRELVCPDKGALNSRCVCLFSPPGSEPLTAFVDRTGIYVSDLFTVKKLTQRFDWSQIDLSNCSLVNDYEHERLVLQSGPNLFYINYDMDHWNDGLPSITGPVQRPGGIGALVPVITDAGRLQLVSTDLTNNPSLCYEDTLFTDGTIGSALPMRAVSREIYPFGQGNEGKAQSFSVHTTTTAGSGQWTATLLAKTKATERLRQLEAIPLGSRKLTGSTSLARFEAIQLVFEGDSQGTENGLGINGFTVDIGETGPAQRYGA